MASILKTQRTTVIKQENGDVVEMLIADNSDQEKAQQFVSIKMILPLAQNPLLAAMQKETLDRARDVIGEEMNRIATLLGFL